MPLDELKRHYRMSDSELCMFTSNLVLSMTRDIAEFTLRSITGVEISALEDLGDAFEILPPDTYYNADVSLAVQNKDAQRAALEILVRDVVQCSVIKWGEGSPQYRKFGAAKMANMNDMHFLTMCRLVVTTATDYLADLAEAGLTQAMIDAVDTGAQTFEDNLNAVKGAIENRDIKKDERIQKGNEIYALVVKYCEIGKIIFDDVSPSKYNDYVIYGGQGTLPAKVVGLQYNVNTGTLSWTAADGATSYEAAFAPDMPEPIYINFWNGTALSTIYDPGGPDSYLFKVRAKNSAGYGEWSEVLIVVR